MDDGRETATNGMTVEEEDDFFGDQSSDSLEAERLREVEVLRRQHMTTGIREGASAAHDKHLQQGFDDGFAAAAKVSAEPAFLMGACAVLEAFFSKGTEGARPTSRSHAFGDTEVPAQDIKDIEQAGTQLQADLRELPEGGSVEVERAKEACRRVAIFEVPSIIAAPSSENEQLTRN